MISYSSFLLFGAIFFLSFLWSFIISFSVIWLYLKSLILFLLNIIGKKIGKNFNKKINKEKFEAFFNSPLLIYPFIIFSSVVVFTFIQENIIKYMDKTLYIKMYNAESSVVFLFPVFSIVILYLGIILFYTYYYEGDTKENIMDTFERHKKFFKIILIPTALIGIVVPLISVANIFVEENTKKEMLTELTNFSISDGMQTFLFVIVFTLIYSAIGNFFLNILIHILEEIKYYSYFPKATKNFFVKLVGINKKEDSTVRKPPKDEG